MSRPTLLLLHAMPLDGRMWDGLRTPLEEAGYRVEAPDLPGDDPVAGIGAWAERVLALVDGPFVPVGSSLGGYLTFELWRRAPERIPALALVGTRATADAPAQRTARAESIRTLREDGHEAFWDGLAPNLFSPDADPLLVASARELALEQPLAGLVATLETLRDRPDSRPTLATIDVPALVVVGEDDAVTPPADAEAMAAAIGSARLLRLPGAGHLVAIEWPAAVAEAVLDLLEESAR